MIQEALLPGKENLKTTEELVKYYKLDSVRELTQIINKERTSGAVILSTTSNGGGYYLPADDLEIKEFIRSMDNRVKRINQATESARKLLEAMK